MKSLRMFGFMAVAVVCAASLPASAGATELRNSVEMVASGSTVSAEAEGTFALNGPFGGIECSGSTISAKTSTTGGASETVKANVETFTFTGCSSTVTVLAKGTLEIHTKEAGANGNGTLTSSGAEVTTEKLGVHCIYKTSATTLGTITGSVNTGKTATYDIAGSIPRTGGKSGAFCGSTGEVKGSYKVTTPDTLNVDTGSVPTATSLSTSLSGESKSGEEITVNEGSKVKDTATLSGTNAGKATGTVKYKVYADKECKELVTSAGEVTVSEGKVPASEEKTLEAGRVYYWQAEYSGDSSNEASKSTCGKEVLTVKAATSIATSLSGEAKTGEEITILEGSKAKDTATLSGTRASAATGKVKFKAYKDKECKELAAEAGEGSLSEGKATSEEKTLEAAAVYYWQAEYAGDSLHQASTTTCGKEVLTVKAATSIATSLSGEAKTGEELTILEGSKAKDTATLSGTRSSAATGKVKFKAYKDKECKELAAEAGEGSLSEGKASSEEKALEAAAVYYWQAEYAGDSLHQASTSTCGKEVLTVKAATSLSTLLGGEDPVSEEPIEGEEITVAKGTLVADSAALSGTKSATATGNVSFNVYADGECKELVTEAGEASLEEGSAAPSEKLELEEGAYHWQATYEGDSLHQASTSPCTEVVNVVAGTSLTTTLSGEAEEGEVIEVSEEALVTDRATLNGAKAAEATGSVEYFVYSDVECTELVTEAGEVSVSGESVPASSGVTLEPGFYYWQAVYSGDSANRASTSPCGSELEMVVPRITTTLSGGGESAGSLRVSEGTPVHDEGTLHGKHAAEATGSVEYFVYADEECEELVTEAGEVKVEGAGVAASNSVELEAPGTYYWQAAYSGDEQNPASTSICGSEVSILTVPTSVATTLSGGGKEGAEITVEEGTPVSDQATLSGAEAATATGHVRYSVYQDSSCTEEAATGGVGDVEEGAVDPSSEVTLPPGTYYWQAEYWGDDVNGESIGKCGSEVETVTAPITTSLSDGSQAGTEIEVEEGASVTDQATLHGEHAAEATGTIEYFVYSDEECKELFAEAGKSEFSEGKVPASSSVEFEEVGVYFWRAKYSGDGKNPAATSPCGGEAVQVIDPKNWKYAAFGNSYSSGEGVRWTGGSFYYYTATWSPSWADGNKCHRSEQAWPALVAESALGAPAIKPPDIYKRTNRFIFRACSGATTANLSPGPGQYGEQEEPGGKWIDRPAQLSWLPGAPENEKVSWVSVGIGGNDAGFGDIARACWSFTRTKLGKLLKKYDPASCQAEIKSWEEAKGFGAIKDHLPPILKAVAQSAPNAEIRVFFYPHVINTKPDEISVGPGVIIDNQEAGKGDTAAKSIETYLGRLNLTIQDAVDAAKVKRAKAVKATDEAFTKFGKHRLGDDVPWLNGLVFYLEESFHPGICGHKAVAVLAQPELVPKGTPPIAPCKP